MAFSQTVFVPRLRSLTITADANTTGFYYLIANPLGSDPGASVSISASTTTAIGPFANDRTYGITNQSGAVTYAVAIAEFPADSEPSDVEALSANMNTIPAARSMTVGQYSQIAIFKTLTVLGSLTITGELRVTPWPA